jgi:hypothetical protein
MTYRSNWDLYAVFKKLIVAAALVLATTAATAEPYMLQSEWVTFKGKEYANNSKLYRRYALTKDPKQELANLVVYHCPLDGTVPFVSFQLPRLFDVRSFARDQQTLSLTSKFLINGEVPSSVTGEYSSGEFYFDLTEDNVPALSKVLEAELASLQFGEKKDTFEFGFASHVNKAFRSFAKAEDLDAKFGRIKYFSSKAMLQDCVSERQRRR